MVFVEVGFLLILIMSKSVFHIKIALIKGEYNF